MYEKGKININDNEFVVSNIVSVLIWIKWSFSFDVMQGVFFIPALFSSVALLILLEIVLLIMKKCNSKI